MGRQIWGKPGTGDCSRVDGGGQRGNGRRWRAGSAPWQPVVWHAVADGSGLSRSMGTREPMQAARLVGGWAMAYNARLTSEPAKSPRGRRGAVPAASTPGRFWRTTSMIVTTKELFQQAYGKYAVGAYNINNLEQTVGLFRGNLGLVDVERRPGRSGHQCPVHHPDLARRPRLHRQAVSGSDDPRRRRGVRQGDLRRPSGPRHRRGLLRLHRQRILFAR